MITDNYFNEFFTVASILVNKLIIPSYVKRTRGYWDRSYFKSYLTGRTQKIHINDCFSDFANITCGVPQGSILGPLLFLCYINDMGISISQQCKLFLYADDSTIIFSHRNPDIIRQRLGHVLENCSKQIVTQHST